MQARKFIIKIYKDYDWEIKITSLSDYALYYEINLGIFAIARQTEDTKIVYLFDADFQEDDFEVAKKDERFHEVCTFEVIIDDGTGEKSVAGFDGTFIDALAYVQKEFRD